MRIQRPDDSLLAPYLEFSFTRDDGAPYRLVDTMMLDFMPDSEEIPVRQTISTKWEQLDKCAARFAALKVVTIGLASLEDLALFVKEVEPQLTYLRANDKLRYAVWNGKPKLGWKWLACHPGSRSEGAYRTQRRACSTDKRTSRRSRDRTTGREG